MTLDAVPPAAAAGDDPDGCYYCCLDEPLAGDSLDDDFAAAVRSAHSVAVADSVLHVGPLVIGAAAVVVAAAAVVTGAVVVDSDSVSGSGPRNHLTTQEAVRMMMMTASVTVHQQEEEDSGGRDDQMISRTGNDSNGRERGCQRTLPSIRISYCVPGSMIVDCVYVCMYYVV